MELNVQSLKSVKSPPTFGSLILDWLLEGGDVAEGAEKQDDFVLFVPDRSNLHKEPHRHPCSAEDSSHMTNRGSNQGAPQFRTSTS